GATIGLGILQEAENHLDLAEQAYRSVLQSFGDQPLPFASEALLVAAVVRNECNSLNAAEQYGPQSVQLVRQIENNDRFVTSEVLLARLKLARGDVTGAAAMLVRAEQAVRQHNFAHRAPEVAAAQVLTLLRQGNLVAATQLAQTHELPISRARVHLAQGDPSTALAILGPFRRQVEAKGWEDERLKAMVLQAGAPPAPGAKGKAVQLLGAPPAPAGPGGFIRLFVDEGP